MSLDEREIETALYDIDNIANKTQSKNRGPFSVFRLDHTTESSKLISSSSHVEADTANLCLNNTNQEHFNDEGLVEIESCHSEEPPFDIEYQLPESDSNFLEHTTPAPHNNITSFAISPQASPNDFHTPSAADDPVLKSLGILPPRYQSASSPFHLAARPDEVFLNDEVKLLLRNYASKVLPIFSPLDISNTPWKLLHLPCALQCSIELEILGHSAPSKRALLHTILTISAYNLRNTDVSENQSEARVRWNRVASRYKGEALKLLETCVSDSSTKPPNAVYNEILAAMLAMVTIDVSGIAFPMLSLFF